MFFSTITYTNLAHFEAYFLNAVYTAFLIIIMESSIMGGKGTGKGL